MIHLHVIPRRENTTSVDVLLWSCPVPYGRSTDFSMRLSYQKNRVNVSSQKHTLKNVRQVAATNGVLAKNGQSSPAILIWIDLVLLANRDQLKLF